MKNTKKGGEKGPKPRKAADHLIGARNGRSHKRTEAEGVDRRELGQGTKKKNNHGVSKKTKTKRNEKGRDGFERTGSPESGIRSADSTRRRFAKKNRKEKEDLASRWEARAYTPENPGGGW